MNSVTLAALSVRNTPAARVTVGVCASEIELTVAGVRHVVGGVGGEVAEIGAEATLLVAGVVAPLAAFARVDWAEVISRVVAETGALYLTSSDPEWKVAEATWTAFNRALPRA
jgi:hypothetical protein